jgi:hypothetical protein
MKLFRAILWIQASYIFLTAVWPLVDIRSFMEVTGYKTDIWLVKTVGALLIPVAACLYCHLFTRTNHTPALILGALTAVAFICVDLYYSLNDVISDIYLADGAVELVFLIAWILAAPKVLKQKI